MNETHPEPPAATPPLPHRSDTPGGSLAAGVGWAWLIMIVGEVTLPFLGAAANDVAAIIGSILLPPLVILVWGIVLLTSDKPRQGKGMLLGLLSIAAVALLLVAACFGLLSNFH